MKMSVGGMNLFCFFPSFAICLLEFFLRSLDKWHEVGALCLNLCTIFSFLLIRKNSATETKCRVRDDEEK